MRLAPGGKLVTFGLASVNHHKPEADLLFRLGIMLSFLAL